jgi:hypothetical protein
MGREISLSTGTVALDFIRAAATAALKARSHDGDFLSFRHVRSVPPSEREVSVSDARQRANDQAKRKGLEHVCELTRRLRAYDESGASALALIARRLFPELYRDGDIGVRELIDAIKGHCWLYHKLDAQRVDEMTPAELAELLKKDVNAETERAKCRRSHGMTQAEGRCGRGRPRDTDAAADARLRDEWQQSGLSSYAQFAAKKGMKARDVKLAVDRARKHPR